MLLFFCYALCCTCRRGEGEGVHAVRPHLCLSSLKGVSPGGEFERAARATLTFSNLGSQAFFKAFYCDPSVFSSREVGRKERGREARRRWSLWGWKSCQTQTCTDADRRDQTVMEIWQQTASGEFIFLIIWEILCLYPSVTADIIFKRDSQYAPGRTELVCEAHIYLIDAIFFFILVFIV